MSADKAIFRSNPWWIARGSNAVCEQKDRSGGVQRLENGFSRHRLRGSALSFVTVSDGKPCSGVRGGQKASTDFPQQADARLPTLHGKGKTLFRTLFSPCKF